MSGQVALRIKVLRQPTIFAVFLQRSIHQILHAAGRSVFIVLQLKVRIASIFLRQLLSVKAGDASFVGIAHVRGGNSQAVVLVHISVLGTVGQRHIKRRDAAGLFVMACFAGAGIVNELRAVREGAGERHPVVKIVIVLLFGFIGLQVLFHGLLAVGVDDFLHLAQLNGLVALGVLFDVEGDLEMTALRVIGTAVIGVILFGGLFGLFLRGLLRAGTFLALFLRVAGVSIAGAGGLLAGIALIFGVVLVLALDVVLVVLGGAGQGLDGVGLLRALNGGFVVRRGIVTVALAVGGLVGVVTGGSDRLFFGLSVIRRVSVSALLSASGTTVTRRPESSVSGRASAAEAPHMPTELLSTERASVIATICFFLDFFLIIVILTSLETVFLAQLFRNLQHKIDARWAVLIILYYIRFPKISRGQIARKKACTEISAD